VTPEGQILWPKFEILTVLGAVFPHFCPGKREIWYGGATLPNVTFIGATFCPMRGEKPIFRPLSKTMPAWLRYTRWPVGK